MEEEDNIKFVGDPDIREIYLFTGSSPQISQHMHTHTHNLSRRLTRYLSQYRTELGEEAVWEKAQNPTFSTEQKP